MSPVSRLLIVAVLFGRPAGSAADLVRLEPEKDWLRGCKVDDADRDGDGLADEIENRLARQFAPIVYHGPDETILPANVDWMLARTSLWFHDDDCNTHWKVWPRNDGDVLDQRHLHWRISGTCGVPDHFDSYGWADHKDKKRTFYLKDLPDRDRTGSQDPRDWITYTHVYPLAGNRVAIQYWRCYPSNDGTGYAGLGKLFGTHGGDWEGLHVIARRVAAETYAFDEAWFINHDGFVKRQPLFEDGRPVVFVEPGNHGTRPRPYVPFGLPQWLVDVERYKKTCIRHDSRAGGGLKNVGEKCACHNG